MRTKIKRLATTTDLICHIAPNISPPEMKQRVTDYDTLSDKKMKTSYINYLFRPVHLHWKDKTYEIQLNYCSNPFCKNFHQPQISYNVGKIKRYKMTGKEEDQQSIAFLTQLILAVCQLWGVTRRPFPIGP